MTPKIALFLVLLLAACAQPSCQTTARDGGIGGTGGCAQDPIN